MPISDLTQYPNTFSALYSPFGGCGGYGLILGFVGAIMIKMLGFRVDRYVDGQDLPSEFADDKQLEFSSKNGLYSFLRDQLAMRMPRPTCAPIEWDFDIIDSSPSFEHGVTFRGTIRLPGIDAENPDCMISIIAELELS